VLVAATADAFGGATSVDRVTTEARLHAAVARSCGAAAAMYSTGKHNGDWEMSPLERQSLFRNAHHHISALERVIDLMLRDAARSAYELGVISGALTRLAYRAAPPVAPVPKRAA
jgi:hypothetical protein